MITFLMSLLGAIAASFNVNSKLGLGEHWQMQFIFFTICAFWTRDSFEQDSDNVQCQLSSSVHVGCDAIQVIY